MSLRSSSHCDEGGDRGSSNSSDDSGGGSDDSGRGSTTAAATDVYRLELRPSVGIDRFKRWEVQVVVNSLIKM